MVSSLVSHNNYFQRDDSKEGFSSESLMVDTFCEKLEESYSDRYIGHQNEFDCDNGIADTVVFQLRKDYLKHTDVGKISPNWAYTLKVLPYRKQFTLDEFRALTGAGQNTARSVLSSYVSNGFCIRKKDKWFKAKQPVLLANKIISVEAKLTNWKRAIWQAGRYLEFSHQSWVLMDDSRSGPAKKNLERFKLFNVGLATINTSGAVLVHFEPESKQPRCNIKLWRANSMIARHYLR